MKIEKGLSVICKYCSENEKEVYVYSAHYVKFKSWIVKLVERGENDCNTIFPPGEENIVQ